jgi:hypothetical protein
MCAAPLSSVAKKCTCQTLCKFIAAEILDDVARDITAALEIKPSAIEVSGFDLSQYLQPASHATPFERFLKEDNGLHQLASLPQLERLHKL